MTFGKPIRLFLFNLIFTASLLPVWIGIPQGRIHSIVTNEATYPFSQVPAYAKLEITFDVSTEAQNLQLPYDTTPPPGIQPRIGISVQARFSPDNWRTVYTQPAFYYQGFQDEVKGQNEWFYPTGKFTWKVRFAPHQAGTWQYKLSLQDAAGSYETGAHSFVVSHSANPGFVRVSRADRRYFEFEDGSFFPGLGYNMNFDHVAWVNPIRDNQENFEKMSQNGIQLARIWLSEWGIYGSAWNPWNSIDPSQHGLEIPYTGLTFEAADPGSDVSMQVGAQTNPCMFIGAWKARPAVKRNTVYRIRIRYKTEGITGPTRSGLPYGFVAKTGGWLWGPGEYCYETGSGQPVSDYQNRNTSGWQILEGSLNSGNSDFLPYLYLVMENTRLGRALVDRVWVEEDLGYGRYGPNILPKPWMAHHLYMEQRNSYAFDKVLDLAARHGIYLKVVVLEKNDWIFNRIDTEGNPIPFSLACQGANPANDPEKCPSNDWFYSEWRQMTKVRWLQQAWWRYLQARWGYSTSIHSWELLNEGDPASTRHYALADEFGRYMHQFQPDDHLVTTSFWHSFPKDQFWANPAYPNVDYADLHEYIAEDDPRFADTAWATYVTSLQYGANRPGGAGSPLMRAETGFVTSGSAPPTGKFEADQAGIWLHNFVWGGINPGGMLESYWYETSHIYLKKPNGSYAFDFRPIFRTFYNFVRDLPLNNGYYQDARARVSLPELRAWGQKDLVNGRAHLWIQNSRHTWKNVVSLTPIPPLSGTVTLSGFRPEAQYTVQWWDPYQPDLALQVLFTETVTARSNGALVLPIDELETDLAVKISP